MIRQAWMWDFNLNLGAPHEKSGTSDSERSTVITHLTRTPTFGFY